MTCLSGKVMHATRDEALEMQKRLVWSNHVRGQGERSAGLDVYPCEECSTWHVGHSQIPTVYHYDTVAALDLMTDTIALVRPKPRRLPKRDRRQRSGRSLALMRAAYEEQVPLVWFSWNANWNFFGAPHPGWFIGAPGEGNGEGLLRIGVSASVAKWRWSDYLTRNDKPSWLRDSFARLGNPAEWLATDRSVTFSSVRTIEVRYRGAWVNPHAVHSDDMDAFLRSVSRTDAGI